MHSIKFKDRVITQDVFKSVLYKAKVLHPHEGAMGWIHVDGKDFCLVYCEDTKQWERPTERFASRRLRRLEHSSALL